MSQLCEWIAKHELDGLQNKLSESGLRMKDLRNMEKNDFNEFLDDLQIRGLLKSRFKTAFKELQGELASNLKIVPTTMKERDLSDKIDLKLNQLKMNVKRIDSVMTDLKKNKLVVSVCL